MIGDMHVEFQIPRNRVHDTPVVFFAGSGLQIIDLAEKWLATKLPPAKAQR
jgi:hypothetical protein